MQAIAKSPLTCLPKARLTTINLFVFISVGPRVLHPSNYLSFCLSIYPFVSWCIYHNNNHHHLSACLSICLSIHLPISLTTYHLYIYSLLTLDKHDGSWKLGEWRGLPCTLESPPLIVGTCTSVLRHEDRSVLTSLQEFRWSLENSDGRKAHKVIPHNFLSSGLPFLASHLLSYDSCLNIWRHLPA